MAQEGEYSNESSGFVKELGISWSPEKASSYGLCCMQADTEWGYRRKYKMAKTHSYR
jgi:hypothetical protein